MSRWVATKEGGDIDWRAYSCGKGCGCSLMRWWKFCPSCGERLPPDAKIGLWQMAPCGVDGCTIRCAPHDCPDHGCIACAVNASTDGTHAGPHTCGRDPTEAIPK